MDMVLAHVLRFFLCTALGIGIGFCAGIYIQKTFQLQPGSRIPYGYLLVGSGLIIVASLCMVAFTATY